eukprot:Polyplicarium_translucidae@DN3125_c0_g1_i1.p1
MRRVASFPDSPETPKEARRRCCLRVSLLAAERTKENLRGCIEEPQAGQSAECLFSVDVLVFVGAQNSHLSSLALSGMYRCILQLDPNTQMPTLHDQQKLLRAYSQKMSHVERARNKPVFGLLVNLNTTTMAGNRVRVAKQRLRERCVCIGTLTIEKIADFPEIDVLVVLSCNWSLRLLLSEESAEQPTTDDFLDVASSLFVKKSLMASSSVFAHTPETCRSSFYRVSPYIAAIATFGIFFFQRQCFSHVLCVDT